MDKIIAWFNSLPKWVQILFAVALVSALGFGVYAAVYGLPRKDTPAETASPSSGVILDVPDGVHNSGIKNSKMASYDQYDPNDYWREVAGDPSDSGKGEGSGLVTNSYQDPESADYLDPSIYSETDIYLIRSGYKTKKQVDEERMRHEKNMKMLDDAMNVDTSVPAPSRPVNSDSLYFARLERAMEITQKYSNPAKEAEPPVEEEPQPRHIDVSGSAQQALPMDSFQSDGIITSLDDVQSSGGGIVRYADGRIQAKPVKATFLKTEKLSNGQRVTVRLLQDLVLSDGTRIPANTHISGTCNLGKRLEINIKTLHYGNKMFPTDLNVYDNDGTEGIYCPIIENKMRQRGENVAEQAATSTGALISGAMSRSYLGLAASALTGIGTAAVSEISRSIARDGSVSINVSSGYEFYIFENVKENS